MFDLRVDHGGLAGASTDLTTAAQNLQRIIDELEAALNGRQQSWSGAAKEAYLPAKARWNGAIADLRQLLHDLGVAVDRSNQAYFAADLQGSRLFR